MPFKLISRPDPAPKEFLVTNNEAIKYGQCVKFANGRVTAAGPTDAVAGVAQHDVVAGTDKTCKVILVDPEQDWEVEYIGTPAAGFVVGANAVALNAANNPTGAVAGIYLNAATVTGGPCSVVKVDTAAKKAVVKFKNRQLT